MHPLTVKQLAQMRPEGRYQQIVDEKIQRRIQRR